MLIICKQCRIRTNVKFDFYDPLTTSAGSLAQAPASAPIITATGNIC